MFLRHARMLVNSSPIAYPYVMAAFELPHPEHDPLRLQVAQRQAGKACSMA